MAASITHNYDFRTVSMIYQLYVCFSPERDEETQVQLVAYRNKQGYDGDLAQRAYNKVASIFAGRKESKKATPVPAPRSTPKRPAPVIQKKPNLNRFRTLSIPTPVALWVYTDDERVVSKAVDMIYQEWDSKSKDLLIKEPSLKDWPPEKVSFEVNWVVLLERCLYQREMPVV